MRLWGITCGHWLSKCERGALADMPVTIARVSRVEGNEQPT
jgi:hypothetical protein